MSDTDNWLFDFVLICYKLIFANHHNIISDEDGLINIYVGKQNVCIQTAGRSI